MIGVGDAIPDVRVWRSTSESVGLRELAGEAPYLLLSYLFDWSSTCTNELSELNARRADLLATGVTPYGLSRDSPFSHVAWQQASGHRHPAALRLDRRRRARTRPRAGVPGHARRGQTRRAFVVDGDGIIRSAWRYGESEVSDFDRLVTAARSLS